MSIRILLVDDHEIMRQGLQALIEGQPGMAVVGEASDGREAVRVARETSPSVVIMDVAMPGLNGIEATRQLVAQLPGIKVVGLSIHSDRRFVAEMLRAGASGYVPKECAFEELLTAIRAVAQGGVYLSPRIASVVVEECLRRPGGADQGGLALTPREREVLQLLAEGHNVKQIALILGISGKTVETHRRQIMVKLGLDSMAELTKYAVREGLTTLQS